MELFIQVIIGWYVIMAVINLSAAGTGKTVEVGTGSYMVSAVIGIIFIVWGINVL